MIIMYNKTYNISVWVTLKYVSKYLARGFRPLSTQDIIHR